VDGIFVSFLLSSTHFELFLLKLTVGYCPPLRIFWPLRTAKSLPCFHSFLCFWDDVDVNVETYPGFQDVFSGPDQMAIFSAHFRVFMHTLHSDMHAFMHTVIHAYTCTVRFTPRDRSRECEREIDQIL